MKVGNLLFIVAMVATGGYAFGMMDVQPKTKGVDLCTIPQGQVEGVVGQTLSMKDATLPNRVSVLIGSPSSECTVAITMHRSQVNFEMGEIISVSGIASPFGVMASSVIRNPSKSYTIDGDSGLDVVEGVYSYRDVRRVPGDGADINGQRNPYLYKIRTIKGSLTVPDAQISVINRYGDATKLRLTFDRTNTVTSIQQAD